MYVAGTVHVNVFNNMIFCRLSNTEEVVGSRLTTLGSIIRERQELESPAYIQNDKDKNGNNQLADNEDLHFRHVQAVPVREDDIQEQLIDVMEDTDEQCDLEEGRDEQIETHMQHDDKEFGILANQPPETELIKQVVTRQGLPIEVEVDEDDVSEIDQQVEVELDENQQVEVEAEQDQQVETEDDVWHNKVPILNERSHQQDEATDRLDHPIETSTDANKLPEASSSEKTLSKKLDFSDVSDDEGDEDDDSNDDDEYIPGETPVDDTASLDPFEYASDKGLCIISFVAHPTQCIYVHVTGWILFFKIGFNFISICNSLH